MGANNYISDWFTPMDIGNEPIDEDMPDFDNHNFDFFII